MNKEKEKELEALENSFIGDCVHDSIFSIYKTKEGYKVFFIRCPEKHFIFSNFEDAKEFLNATI